MFSFLATASYSQAKKPFTLVIDAGHGGHDSGTTGNNKYKKYEKDVALKIAIKFGKLVGKYMSDVKVVYTRKTDVFIKLINRPKIANDNNADLFMSIHCNANNNSTINGSETYVLGTHQNENNFNVAKKENSVIYLEDDYSVNYEGFDPNSMSSIVGLTLGQEQYLENSLLLASLVQKNFKKNTELRSRGSNGIKQAGFWVLARNSMPSILVEAGFLSNDKDAKYLMSERGTYEVANALFLGFKEYKKFWDEQSGMNYSNPNITKEIAVSEDVVDASKVDETVVDETVKSDKVEEASLQLSKREKAMAEVAKAEETAKESPKVEEAVVEVANAEEAAKESPKVEEAVAEVAKAEETAKESPKVEEVEKPKVKSSTEKIEAKSTVAMMIDPKPSDVKATGTNATTTTTAHVKVEEKNVPTPKVETEKVIPKNVDRIEYAIQLLSSKKKISIEDKTFKGLVSISYYKDGATYKYIYNRNSSYDKVLSSQRIVKNKGFKGSFIVSFKNGKRISLSRALKEDKSR